jgi:hypothetical protein
MLLMSLHANADMLFSFVFRVVSSSSSLCVIRVAGPSSRSSGSFYALMRALSAGVGSIKSAGEPGIGC